MLCVSPATRLTPQSYKVYPPRELSFERTHTSDLPDSDKVIMFLFGVRDTSSDFSVLVANLTDRAFAALRKDAPLSQFSQPTHEFCILTGFSADTVTLESSEDKMGASSNLYKERETSAITLDAPPLAIASIATALADFTYPSHENRLDDMNSATTTASSVTEEVKKPKKRPHENDSSPSESYGTSASNNSNTPQPPPTTSSSNSSTSEEHQFNPAQVLEAWGKVAPENTHDSTIDEDVGRHTKIRFVEKIITTITTNVDGPDSMMEDSWSIPAMSSIGAAGAAWSAPQEQHSAPSQPISALSLAANAIDNPLQFLDDSELEALDDEQLDNILDSLLIRIVEQLVEMSAADSELQDELNAPDKSGFTLLHYASMYNLQALVPVLLARGANPDTRTTRGNLTPLHLACGADNMAIVELLVRHGCAINVKDSFDMTPADHAYSNGFPELAQWLKNKMGLDVEQRSENRASEDYLMEEMSTESPPPSASPGPSSVGNSGGSGKPPGTTQSGFKGGAKNLSSQKEMLQNAFTNLSLKDKLAINVLVKKQQHQQQKAGKSSGGDGGPSATGLAGKKQKQHRKLVAKVMGTKGSANVRKDVIMENDREDDMDSDLASSFGHGSSADDPDKLTHETMEMFNSSPSRTGRSLRTKGERDARSESNLNRLGEEAYDSEDVDDDDDDDDDAASDNDLSSVFSESDRESLDVALSLLNQNELKNLHDDSAKIESNVRAWMLRKNYQTLREAQRALQTTMGTEQISGAISSGCGDIINPGEALFANRSPLGDATPPELGERSQSDGAGRRFTPSAGYGNLSEPEAMRMQQAKQQAKDVARVEPERKKNLSNVKNQALAALVIRKNILRPQNTVKKMPAGVGSLGEQKTSYPPGDEMTDS
jgi:hypothetical protein